MTRWIFPLTILVFGLWILNPIPYESQSDTPDSCVSGEQYGTTVEWSPDGEFLLVGNLVGLYAYSQISQYEEPHLIDGSPEFPFDVAFSQDGTRFAVASLSNSIRIFSAKNLSLIQTIDTPDDAVRAVAFGGDESDQLVYASMQIDYEDTGMYYNFMVHLIDLSSQQTIFEIKDKDIENHVVDLQVTPDGEIVINVHFAGYGKSEVLVWNMEQGLVESISYRLLRAEISPSALSVVLVTKDLMDQPGSL
jgi:WD40 repeat protein